RLPAAAHGPDMDRRHGHAGEPRDLGHGNDRVLIERADFREWQARRAPGRARFPAAARGVIIEGAAGMAGFPDERENGKRRSLVEEAQLLDLRLAEAGRHGDGPSTNFWRMRAC